MVHIFPRRLLSCICCCVHFTVHLLQLSVFPIRYTRTKTPKLFARPWNVRDGNLKLDWSTQLQWGKNLIHQDFSWILPNDKRLLRLILIEYLIFSAFVEFSRFWFSAYLRVCTNGGSHLSFTQVLGIVTARELRSDARVTMRDPHYSLSPALTSTTILCTYDRRCGACIRKGEPENMRAELVLKKLSRMGK